MTKEEFNTIIKPLSLLDTKARVFLQTALLNNFEKWEKEAINFTDSCTRLTGKYIIELSDNEMQIVSVEELAEMEKQAMEFDGFVPYIVKGKAGIIK